MCVMGCTADRNGNVVRNDSGQDRFLEKLYGSRTGRFLLKPLVSPVVSEVMGKVLDSRVSALAVGPFIRSNGINMKDYLGAPYRSYNDFFVRRIRPGVRKIEKNPGTFISPCDSRLSVYTIDGDCRVKIKHTPYTLNSLLRNHKLAKRFEGGYLWVFRLCVDDYHRYIYVDNGMESGHVKIPGVFHTVNPVANDVYPIYKENTREYSLLRSDNFGTLLQMEVGALMVGKIQNHYEHTQVCRGFEKGNFAFGGSTIILISQKNRVQPDEDILSNSLNGIETRVHLGEKIGVQALSGMKNNFM